MGAFTASVQMPAFPVGVQPSLSSTLMVPRTGDFTVTWTGGAAGAVEDLILSASAGGSPRGTIQCLDVPDTAGSITVPSALLSSWSVGDSLGVTLARFVITSTTGPNVSVTFGASAQLHGAGVVQ